MKVVILAGGHGSRLAEETSVKPKPMVEIGGIPILWHIMKMFDHYDFKDFVIALGYKGEIIKEYIENYVKNHSHVRVDFSSGTVKYTDYRQLDWKVDLVETGRTTLTGGRVKRLGNFLGKETFMCCYGDGVSNLDLRKLVEFHRAHGKLATLTAVRPSARFGHVELNGDQVAEFSEKPQTSEGWINGGFFVFEPKVLDYIEGDHIDLSREPLERLVKEGQLMAYRHPSFWQCMDTLREKFILENLWDTDRAPWKLWTD
jgi:glucose-1-phosphate cytidylyltransferase